MPAQAASAPHEQDEAGDEQQREHDLAEAHRIDAVEEQHAERGAPAAGRANEAASRHTWPSRTPVHQYPARMTTWFTTKKAWRLALMVRGLHPCVAEYRMTGGPGVPTAAPITPASTPAPADHPRPARRLGWSPAQSSRTIRTSVPPMRRFSVEIGNTLRTQTPTGTPRTVPTSMSSTGRGSRWRRSGTKIAADRATV